MQKEPNTNRDFAINELTDALRQVLQATHWPWLNSWSLCTGYVPNPAERVMFIEKEGLTQEVVYFRIVKRFGFLKYIDIIGFPNINNEVIFELKKRHQAHLVTINRLENPIKPDEQWHATESHIFAKSYVTIVSLPKSREEYLTLLGRNKKKQLPQYWRRLNKDFNDSLEIRYEVKDEIKLEDVIQLENLNKSRRIRKGKGVDSEAEIRERQTRRFPLTKASGLLITFRSNDEILGGTLNYIHGKESLMIVVAHNPKYEYLRIGNLSIWKTMEYLIDHGIPTCNFLWGRHSYKTQYLGIEYPWSVHIIANQKWLALLWKYRLTTEDFYTRALRYFKTKIGLSS